MSCHPNSAYSRTWQSRIHRKGVSRPSRSRRLRASGKKFVCQERVQLGSKDHVCAKRFRCPDSLKNHITRVHSDHGQNICTLTGLMSVFPGAVDSQSLLMMGLEGLKNIAFVVAPILCTIYSRDSWVLSL
jgi:hypothetical protein